MTIEMCHQAIIESAPVLGGMRRDIAAVLADSELQIALQAH